MSEQSKNIAPKIIELFRNELERHSETLDRGLIEAENNNSQSTIEPLMRAAHSIKGAARIVGIMEAVELAHAMEDLLSLAMNGKIMLNSLMIDLLLNANDVFIEISKSGQQDIFDYFAGKSEQISELSAQLRNLAGKKSEQISELQTASNASLPRKKIKDEITAKTEGAGVSNIPASFVRVDSEQLNKILGLAGETLIKTKTIKNLTDNVSKMKFILREILTLTSGRNIYKTKDNELYNKNLAEHLYALRDLLNTHSYDLAELDLKLESLTGKLYYESVTTHMRPFAEGIQSFYRLVRDIAKELQKKVKLVVSGETTKVDRNILEQLEAPLNHLVRNAIDHGIEMPEERRRAGKPEYGTVLLDAHHHSGMLIVSVSDDGRGIDTNKIREKVIEQNLAKPEIAEKLSNAELMDFLFLPGFTTSSKVTEISGRGVGLDVVFSMVQDVGGTISAESIPGKGTKFTLQLPVTLSLIRALIVKIAGEYYAVPLTKIVRLLAIDTDNIEVLNGKKFCKIEDENIVLVEAAEILDLQHKEIDEDTISVVVVSDRLSKYGLIVDAFYDERNLVVKQLPEQLGKIQDIYAASTMDDGNPVLILDIKDIVRNTDNLIKGHLPEKENEKATLADKRKKILIVEDSATVAESLRATLDAAGYNVFVAVDGQDGWNLIERNKFDLIITDIDMPRMNGIELTRKIKSNKATKDIPVIVQTYKDRNEDRDAAEEAGAEMFVSKSTLNDTELVTMIEMLI